MKVIILIIFSLLLAFFFTSCKESINNDIGNEKPFISGYQLCYNKGDNGWTIYTNNINNSCPRKISEPSNYDDYSPQWSPDGRYIVYRHEIEFLGPQTIAYNTQKKTYTILTPDGTKSEFLPLWTPDGKVILSYIKNGESTKSTYIVNPDGSNKKKILDIEPKKIYFYDDSYNFLYIDGKLLYKTNIEGTSKELIQDLKLFPFVFSIDGFNPNTGELLMTKDTASKSMITVFNVNTKEQRNLYIEPVGTGIYRTKFSRDYSKIVFLEDGKEEDFLSILESGICKRLVSSPGNMSTESFSYMPIEFSPDNKYIAFSKTIFLDGPGIVWVENLFAVDITDGKLYFIDKPAYGPSWNPQP